MRPVCGGFPRFQRQATIGVHGRIVLPGRNRQYDSESVSSDAIEVERSCRRRMPTAQPSAKAMSVIEATTGRRAGTERQTGRGPTAGSAAGSFSLPKVRSLAAGSDLAIPGEEEMIRTALGGYLDTIRGIAVAAFTGSRLRGSMTRYLLYLDWSRE